MLLACTAPAAAQTAVSLRVNEYDIQGSTARQLIREMRAKGPSLPTGHRAYGFSSWTLDWSVEPTVEADRCRVGSARVTALITITVPRWINAADGDQKLRDKWLTFRAALDRHEQGHRQNAVDAGQQLYDALLDLPSAACHELTQRARELAKQAIDEGHARDSDYDMRTDHGRKEGVRF